jgi:hypothetical protein
MTSLLLRSLPDSAIEDRNVSYNVTFQQGLGSWNPLVIEKHVVSLLRGNDFPPFLDLDTSVLLISWLLPLRKQMQIAGGPTAGRVCILP